MAKDWSQNQVLPRKSRILLRSALASPGRSEEEESGLLKTVQGSALFCIRGRDGSPIPAKVRTGLESTALELHKYHNHMGP